MRPTILTKTGTGSSGIVVFDILRNPFNVGIGCVASGTVNYTIQHTFDWDEVNNGVPAGATWFNHDDAVFVNATGNAESNFYFPVRAAKILVNSGTGSATATFIQAGLRGG